MFNLQDMDFSFNAVTKIATRKSVDFARHVDAERSAQLLSVAKLFVVTVR